MPLAILLIIIGMVIIQPVAPMGIYGVINNTAHGHVVTTILIAMVAMLFTAISYGRMARIYPSAGSAYTYVGQEIHSAAGYIVGWGMVMDYLLNPLICTAFCAKAAMNILPGLSFYVWILIFAAFFTWMNLRGIRTSGPMAPEIDLSKQRPAQYIFSEQVQKKLSDIRRDEAAAAQQKDAQKASTAA